VPHHVRSAWSTPYHNRSDIYSSSLGEESASYSHYQEHQDCPPEPLSPGGGQNLLSSYWTPESIPQSFPDYDISFNQYETCQGPLDGASDGSLCHWPTLDYAMSPLTDLPYNQTDYGLSIIDPLSMLEDLTRTSNSPNQAELDTSSGAEFSPEFSPQHSQHSSRKG
jgi:hypothetical protein